MTFKHTFTLATALTMSLAMAAPAFAGSNDPIPGIDIIVKEDPGSQKIRNLTLSDRQLEKLGHLEGKEGAHYMAEIVAKHIRGNGGGGGKVDVQDISAAFLEYGCPPMPWSHCGMSIKFKGGESEYTIRLKPHKK